MSHTEVPIKVEGIPAIARVYKCEFHKGNSNAMNPDDFKDTYDLEYIVVDKKGCRAPWLADRINSNDQTQIDVEESIIEEINVQRVGL